MGIGIHGPDSENARGADVAAAAAASAAAASSSLERTLDEATERYSVSPEVQRELCQLKAGLAGATALDVSAPRAGALSRGPRRLRWRGREVSEEFQRYAERVASGEELAPYRGHVLARPCADSPWGVPAPPPPRPARRSVVYGALLAASAWLAGVLLIAPHPPTSNDELRPGSNAAIYASSDPPPQLGPLSLHDVETLRDATSGQGLSPADSDEDVARALTSGVHPSGTTTTVSARRSVARSSIGAPRARPDAPAARAAETIDDFDWLLDSADGPAAAPVGESPMASPPPVPAVTPRSRAGDEPSATDTDPPAPPGSVLLLETPTF